MGILPLLEGLSRIGNRCSGVQWQVSVRARYRHLLSSQQRDAEAARFGWLEGCWEYPSRHVLILGGYVDGKKAPVFVRASPLSDPDVQQIVQTSSGGIIRLCTQHGLLDDTQADPFADEEPVLASLTAASVRGTIATSAPQDPEPASIRNYLEGQGCRRFPRRGPRLSLSASPLGRGVT